MQNVNDFIRQEGGPKVGLTNSRGHIHCWLLRSGACITTDGVMHIPPQPPGGLECLRLRRRYHQVLLDQVGAGLIQLEAIARPGAFNQAAAWSWPAAGSWLREHVGPPVLDVHGQPDAAGAIRHLKSIADRERAAVSELSTLIQAQEPVSAGWQPAPR